VATDIERTRWMITQDSDIFEERAGRLVRLHFKYLIHGGDCGEK
jgi:hypothetical protein